MHVGQDGEDFLQPGLRDEVIQVSTNGNTTFPLRILYSLLILRSRTDEEIGVVGIEVVLDIVFKDMLCERLPVE